MTIKIGQTMPSGTLKTKTDDGVIQIAADEFFQGKKIVLFAVPGAFTPGCSKKHLPSFLESSEKLKEKKIRKVFCISINDPFVMEAWGKNYSLKDEIILLADIKGDFTNIC